MTTNPTLNPEAIQALRDLSPDGDSEFLRELIAIYLADTPKQLAQLAEALARQDAARVIQTAHSLKGSSGNFGAQEFARLAQEMEGYAKANNLEAASAALPGFNHCYAQVAAALKQLAGT